MELSKTERLALINQFRILEKLYPDEAAHYANDREIIAHGYTIEYEGVFGEVYNAQIPKKQGVPDSQMSIAK